jgi:hypothetical protein
MYEVTFDVYFGLEQCYSKNNVEKFKINGNDYIAQIYNLLMQRYSFLGEAKVYIYDIKHL